MREHRAREDGKAWRMRKGRRVSSVKSIPLPAYRKGWLGRVEGEQVRHETSYRVVVQSFGDDPRRLNRCTNRTWRAYHIHSDVDSAHGHSILGVLDRQVKRRDARSVSKGGRNVNHR
jgi:hypothetical protein